MAFRRKRILVIEDDLEMSSLLKDFIKEEGFDVHSAENSSDAFRKLQNESFDLILSDMQMPGWHGLDLLPQLKKLQSGSPVVLITAFGSKEVNRRAVARGADGYLEKPLHLQDLRKVLKNLVSRATRK